MWIVYGLPDQSVETAAFVEGLRRISQPFRVLNHNGFTRGQIEQGATKAFISGLRAKGAEILQSYNEIGIDVAVCDYGYLKRVSGVATFQTGHWQLGLNRLGWVAPDVRKKRLKNLGVELTRRDDPGRAVYVCGQHFGDPMHGLDADGMTRWALKAIAQVRKKTDRPIVWRPHPDSMMEIGGCELSAGPIDWADVHSVVCINSNVGLEAIMNGRPVVCRHDAPYAPIAYRAFGEFMAPPSRSEIEQYLARVSWSQWTLAEIASGEAVEYIERFMRSP